jgi:uncharacterized repeat protein (TIGR03803 family)
MNCKRFLGAVRATLIVAILLAPGAGAQSKYKTLHRFTGGKDGAAPFANLIFDSAGNLYGTTCWGGAHGFGTVFRLAPNADGRWTEKVIHHFTGGKDGGQPYAGLIFDQSGNLYGTTTRGGANDNGTVFQLTPNRNGGWTESLLHSFDHDGKDGIQPLAGLIFDPTGKLYGTTSGGGTNDCGTVFQLAPNGYRSWTERVLYSFCSGTGSDGLEPYSALLLDPVGNLYGTTSRGLGGNPYGIVFELTPNLDGSWTENVLHVFNGPDGGDPQAGLTFDGVGNLYGTTFQGGAFGNGTAFRLTPTGDGNWTESVLHSFNRDHTDGAQPWAGLSFDLAGNLYGTTEYGGSVRHGAVFKLEPTKDSGWHETVLRSFKNQPGAYPRGRLILDKQGNLYGTTRGDSRKTFGSVFEITP